MRLGARGDAEGPLYATTERFSSIGKLLLARTPIQPSDDMLRIASATSPSSKGGRRLTFQSITAWRTSSSLGGLSDFFWRTRAAKWMAATTSERLSSNRAI